MSYDMFSCLTERVWKHRNFAAQLNKHLITMYYWLEYYKFEQTEYVDNAVAYRLPIFPVVTQDKNEILAHFNKALEHFRIPPEQVHGPIWVGVEKRAIFEIKDGEYPGIMGGKYVIELRASLEKYYKI